MDQKFESFINKRVVITKIIWGALLMSICTIAVLSFTVLPGEIDFNFDIQSLLSNPQVLIFSTVALFCGVLSYHLFFIMKKGIESKPFNRSDFIASLKETRGENGVPIYSKSDMEYIESLDDTQLKIFNMQTKMMIPYILRWALTEAIGIMGFVLVQSTGNKAIALPFFLISFLLMTSYFPKSYLESRPTPNTNIR